MFTHWFANSAWFDIPFRPHGMNCGFAVENCANETSPAWIGITKSNKQAVKQRYELVPYYYSLAHRAYRYGEPVIAPFSVYYPHDDAMRGMGHEKFIGKDLLVGVSDTQFQDNRNMYLPAGEWINFHTNEWHNLSQGTWIQNVPVVIGQRDSSKGRFQDLVVRLATFAKAGAIIPMMYIDDQSKDVFGNRKDGSRRDELIVQVYGKGEYSEFTLYEDDGTTVSYYDQNGRPVYDTRTTLLSQQTDSMQATITVGAAYGSYSNSIDFRNNEVRLVTNNQVPYSITLNGASLTQLSMTDFYQTPDTQGWVHDGNRILMRSGAMDVSVEKSFVVTFQGAVNQEPNAVINNGSSITVQPGTTVTFDASNSTDDNQITSYSWSDGSGEFSTETTADYTFNDLGEYSINLTVTDSEGLQSTAQVAVTVSESTAQRTVIFIYGKTDVGQDMFIRGGIDWTYAKDNLGKDCGATPESKWLCAIPIIHNNLLNDTTTPWKTNDEYLDWHGAEPNQSSEAEGTPLDWTTNSWPADWGTPTPMVGVNGSGETSLNIWGHHYWMLDVNIDCANTVDGWFELKSYISNGPGWEPDVRQAGAPYSSGNHFAQCGKINMFKRGESTVEIRDF